MNEFNGEHCGIAMWFCAGTTLVLARLVYTLIANIDVGVKDLVKKFVNRVFKLSSVV